VTTEEQAREALRDYTEALKRGEEPEYPKWAEDIVSVVKVIGEEE
jgi:hypothetical protein